MIDGNSPIFSIKQFIQFVRLLDRPSIDDLRIYSFLRSIFFYSIIMMTLIIILCLDVKRSAPKLWK